MTPGAENGGPERHSWPARVAARVAASAARHAQSPFYPLLGLAMAFAATLGAVAFVPLLCMLVLARGERWGSLVVGCALGSALGATVLAVLAAQYGPQLLEQWLPRVMASHEWRKGVRWVDAYGAYALLAVAALPLSQTPVLIVCALLGMSPWTLGLSVFAGKGAKYAVSAALATSARKHVADAHARYHKNHLKTDT